MVRFRVLSLTCAIFVSAPTANGDTIPSLYVIEATKDNARSLSRLFLNRDNELMKETLVSCDQRFFTNFGEYALVENCFVVAPGGGVVDVQAKKVIHDPNGAVLGYEAGQVFYKVDNAFRDSGIFSFDLKSRKVEKLRDPGHWNLPGSKSPNRTKSAIVVGGVVHLQALDGTKRKLAEGYYVKYLKIASPFYAGANCLWIDDERFLTQKMSSELVVLDTQGNAETLLQIEDAPEVLSPPRLWRDSRGRIIYSCGTQQYLVDLKKKSASALKEYVLDHGFEASVSADKEGRRAVFHDGRLIGRYILNPYQVKTAPGSIAFAFALPEAQLFEGPIGIAMWSPAIGWKAIDCAAIAMVGWAK